MESAMNKYLFYLSSLVLLLATVACDSDDTASFPCGTLDLQVEQNTTMLTKAQQPVTDEVLQVDILTAEGDTVKHYGDYVNEAKGKDILLPAGTYTVSVHSAQTLAAGWEKPFYAGSAEVEIKAGELTATRLVCKIANTKVAVVYADDLADYFTDYTTVVSNSSGALTYTRDEYRAGYFAPEKLVADLSLVNKDGNRFTLQRIFPDIKERTFYKLRFYLSDPGDDDQAGADFDGITVEEKADTVYCNIFIQQESLAGKGKPVLTLEGGFQEQTITYKKESPTVPAGSLRLEVPNGIQRLEVKAASRQFEALGLSLFDLGNLTDKQRAALTSLYFPVPQAVKGEKSLTLTFGEDFTKALDTETAATIGTHTFTVSVLDGLNQESTLTFVYQIRPNVKVTTEQPLAWAKFVLLKGNSGDKEGVGFMLKKKGEAAFTRYEATNYDESTGDFSALVAKGIEPNTEYVYYSVAGLDDKGDEITFTTEGTGTIPNSGFEDWCEVGGLPRPWASGAASFWGCGNSTYMGVDAIMTESSSDHYSGADGDGGKTAVYMKSQWKFVKFAAGNIFTGDFRLNGTNGVLTLGREFSYRPSRLTGYYKYKPAAVKSGNGSGSHLGAGSSDLCSVYIALTDEKITIDTGAGIYFNPSDRAVIAYGELTEEEAKKKVEEYTRFTIDLHYKDLDRMPKYLIIVASSSKYGDYFEGGDGSEMWMDALQLVYPASLSDVKLYE